MNLETMNADLKILRTALMSIEKTDNMNYNKSLLISDLLEAINTLREKRDKQIEYLKKLINSN